MTLTKLFILSIIISVTTARIIHDDESPPQIGFNSPLHDSNQGEVMMKEAILYLTPTQIKAYEASQGQNQGQRNQFTEEEMLNVEAEIKRQLEEQNLFLINPNDKPILNLPKLPPPVVEEPIDDEPFKYSSQYQQNWIPMPKEEKQRQQYFVPNEKDDYKYYSQKPAESYSYIKFFTDDKVHETPKRKLYHPPPREHKIDPELEKFLEERYKKYKSIPYEYKPVEFPKSEEIKEVKLTTLNLLEKYKKEQNTEVEDQTIESPKVEEQRFEQFEKEQPELKYAPQYDNTDEDQKFFIKIEKENALARAEAILKASSAGTRKEIAIKRRPVNKDWPQRYTSISVNPKKESTFHRRVWKH